MHTLAIELGVQFFFEYDVKAISIEKNAAKKITAMYRGQEVSFDADVVIGGADYHFIENKLVRDNGILTKFDGAKENDTIQDLVIHGWSFNRPAA